MALLRSKNPRLAARISPPVAWLLRSIVRESSLNRAVSETRECTGCAFVDAVLSRLEISVEVRNPERFPPSPRIVVCANHPTGGIDGLILMSILCKRYGSVRVPANDLLFVLPGLRELLVPVDKHGSNVAHLEAYREMYNSPHPVLIFPAGRTARPVGGVLREFPWNKAFMKQARLSGRLVVPVRLSGANSRRFYLLWRLRRALKIKANLEMFLLVDELLRRRGENRLVEIHSPCSPAEGTSGAAGDRRRAELLRREVS